MHRLANLGEYSLLLCAERLPVQVCLLLAPGWVLSSRREAAGSRELVAQPASHCEGAFLFNSNDDSLPFCLHQRISSILISTFFMMGDKATVFPPVEKVSP